MRLVSNIKREVIHQLQEEVYSLQRAKKPLDNQAVTGLGAIKNAFPNQTFPTGAVHELISYAPEAATSTNGFIAGLISKLQNQNDTCLWISTRRTIYPPVLKIFGIEPSHVIFIDVQRQQDALWAIEEALKCEALTAVVGELRDLSFTESRRLQLAVEKSNVTGFIHRHCPRSENTVACVTRWKITPLASTFHDSMPGIGFPNWNVELQKVRNGKPGTWQMEWAQNNFRYITQRSIAIAATKQVKTG